MARIFKGGASKYLRAKKLGGLAAAWSGLSKPRKRYAHELVSKFGWTVDLAVQSAYMFPYDEWIFDYKTETPRRYTVNRRTGHIGEEIKG